MESELQFSEEMNGVWRTIITHNHIDKAQKHNTGLKKPLAYVLDDPIYIKLKNRPKKWGHC